ncbi:hypothetical protein TCDM_12568 [Trypanosoma cruzi Dm28c]|uniref:Secreted protein n=1 Tax=Trypanosoma cruzi Dm28c TaxID=1416333 RepID=V5AL04_TRYCR|nr:hypothetical protein TCDM_12568 [Trypanosoma cruzi Dm28c]
MRRGRDERRAEGAVTCGRATRACGRSTHFFPLLLFFLLPGRADTRSAAHTATPCRRVFKIFVLRVYFMWWRTLRCRPREHFSPLLVIFLFLLRSLSRWSDATAVMSACFSQSPHTHE